MYNSESKSEYESGAISDSHNQSSYESSLQRYVPWVRFLHELRKGENENEHTLKRYVP